MLALQPADRVLEVGCGSETNFAYLVDQPGDGRRGAAASGSAGLAERGDC